MILSNIRQQTIKRHFGGTYRLTGRMATFDDIGTPYISVRLSCAEADPVALVDLSTTEIPERISHLEMIDVAGKVYSSPSGELILLDDIKKAPTTSLNKLPALHTLPRANCPAKESLDQLVKIVRALGSEHLRKFICLTIDRRDKLETFLNAPASQHYHHSYPGGLMVHSLEVAKTVVGMIRLTEPDMPQLLQEVGFVAGLLHDIGKTYTYDSKGRATPLYKLCSHDAFTLEACAYGLAYLDKHSPEMAATLRHIWTCASPGSRYGHCAATTLARYVRDADGQNSMSDNQRLAFSGRKNQGFGKIGKNTYWLPTICG